MVGQVQVIVAPKMLNSLIDICAAFSVSQETVKAWVDRGAPIVVDGNDTKRRYSAELTQLHNWRVVTQKVQVQ